MISDARAKRLKAKEFGDFQTPAKLAGHVVQVVAETGFQPRTVFEPTCGRGSFVMAALDRFTDIQRIIGVEINSNALDALSREVDHIGQGSRVDLVRADIFDFDWDHALSETDDPLLILGNPPWVTSSTMGMIKGRNLPRKSNFRLDRGIDAITGRGNFDVSEWIMLESLKRFDSRDVALAMLCKTSVARKLLQHAWKHDYPISNCAMYEINALESFGASVHACFFFAQSGHSATEKHCRVYASLDDVKPKQTLGFTSAGLVSDLESYESLHSLHSSGSSFRWRSGIKHDCSKVMELKPVGDSYRNGFGEVVEIESSHIHRLYKGADVANPHRHADPGFVIVTQRDPVGDTIKIRDKAPLTWRYLVSHRHLFESRQSVVYRDRPPFSMFGIGDYAFTDWKVAVSSLHKKIEFVTIPPWNGKPAMVDDTVYYLPCADRLQAEFLVTVLNSDLAIDFLSSMVFWDEKRPITAGLLNRLDILGLIRELRAESEAERRGIDRCPIGTQGELVGR